MWGVSLFAKREGRRLVLCAGHSSGDGQRQRGLLEVTLLSFSKAVEQTVSFIVWSKCTPVFEECLLQIEFLQSNSYQLDPAWALSERTETLLLALKGIDRLESGRNVSEV